MSGFAGHAFVDMDSVCDSDDEEDQYKEPPKLAADYLVFLSMDSKGPGLDAATIELLSRYGMVDIPRFVMFSQYSFSSIFSFLTVSELCGLS
jgi:hypothetical protein